MKKILKKILLFSLLLLPFATSYTNAAIGDAPSYYDNFSKYFTSGMPDENGEIVDVYNINGISSEKSFQENIRCLFYPNSYNVPGCSSVSRGGSIRDLLKYIGYAIVVLFIIIAGANLLISGSSPDKVKSSLSSLLYIILGAILFFGSIRILGSVLQLETARGTAGLSESIHGNQGSLLFIVLSFAKTFAFIAAILMIVIHGLKMMSSVDKSDKVKVGLKGLINVIAALVIIKLIDYIYYIAQLPDLVSQTTDLIIEIAKIIGFIIGALMLIMLFYAGFLFITDQGSSENMKKAKNIIVGILVTALVIFSLLLIIYEIFNEFG